MTPRVGHLKQGSFSPDISALLRISCHGVAPLFRSASTTVRARIGPNTLPYNKIGECGDHADTTRPKFFRLSTRALLRSVILAKVLQTPLIYHPCLRVLNRLAESKSPLLDADKNFLIRLAVYPLIYKHFCAGRNKAELQQTIAGIKQCGYSGVIICYAKEVMTRKDSEGRQIMADDQEDEQQEIKEWLAGNLTSLSNISEGDYIGVKYTGAGPSVSQALMEGKGPPPAVLQALYEICDQARAENKRLWIDAEQQVYHPTIDKWTVDLMRKYNRDGQVVVLTTIQAYLKSARNTVEWYLKQSQAEGWTLGIKLVRGAYINSDVRSRIHDTKPETDASYDSIAHDLIAKTWKGLGEKERFPRVHVFLAGHNVNSIWTAVQLAHRLAVAGELTEPVHYGLLQGMADDIGCEMLTLGEKLVEDSPAKEDTAAVIERLRAPMTVAALATPRVYKCLTWGSVKDCLHYLVRRAVENQNAAEKLGAGLKDMQTELWRRLLPWK